jgi:hypothetical protein
VGERRRVSPIIRRIERAKVGYEPPSSSDVDGRETGMGRAKMEHVVRHDRPLIVLPVINDANVP